MAKKILNDHFTAPGCTFCEITNICYLSQIELRFSDTLN